jgi:hypothetical protein
MKYIADSHGSRLVPKLIGSYECELRDAIADILDSRPSVVVDVGCAEGYYAVGFARALPDATVYAFDVDPGSQKMCTLLGRLNGIENNLNVRGKCDWKVLEAVLLNRALVMCDCEGYELELLRPDKVPGLRKARLLVELHDLFVPGITSELLRRFERTHEIRLIDIEERHPETYAALRGLSPSMQALAVYERDLDTTPQQQWGYFVPRETAK